MSIIPEFPNFKGIELKDREFLHDALWRYKPQASEYTFTNLFIWRSHYGFEWSVYKDRLLVLCKEDGGGICGLEPVGPLPRREAALMFLEWIREQSGQRSAGIERAERDLVAELVGAEGVVCEPARDHFDYVYLREDLVRLAGNRYRSKRNRINQLLRSCRTSYSHLQERHIPECRELQDKWCMEKRCDEDMDLLGEWEAVKESLVNFHDLKV